MAVSASSLREAGRVPEAVQGEVGASSGRGSAYRPPPSTRDASPKSWRGPEHLATEAPTSSAPHRSRSFPRCRCSGDPILQGVRRPSPPRPPLSLSLLRLSTLVHVAMYSAPSPHRSPGDRLTRLRAGGRGGLEERFVIRACTRVDSWFTLFFCGLTTCLDGGWQF